MLDPQEVYHDLASLIRAKGRKNGARPAIRFDRRTLTYEQLDTGSDRVAANLAVAGIGRADRVALLLLNGPEFVLAWFGLAKLGAVVVPLNTALKGEILRYELSDAEPKALIVDRRLWPSYGPLRAGLGF